MPEHDHALKSRWLKYGPTNPTTYTHTSEYITMTDTSLPLTIALIILLIVSAIEMLTVDAPPTAPQREGILWCHSDGRCTTATGAFWAEVDSVDAANFFKATDEALPPDEGA